LIFVRRFSSPSHGESVRLRVCGDGGSGHGKPVSVVMTVSESTRPTSGAVSLSPMFSTRPVGDQVILQQIVRGREESPMEQLQIHCESPFYVEATAGRGDTISPRSFYGPEQALRPQSGRSRLRSKVRTPQMECRIPPARSFHSPAALLHGRGYRANSTGPSRRWPART